MKSFKLILSITAALMIIACGGKKNAEEDPSIVAEEYVKAMMNYNFDEVKKHITKEALPLYEEAINKFLNEYSFETIENTIRPIMQNAKYETVKREISEDKQTAEVTVQITSRTSTFNDRTFTMAKEDGVWKVHHPIEIWTVSVNYKVDRGLYIDEKGTI